MLKRGNTLLFVFLLVTSVAFIFGCGGGGGGTASSTPVQTLETVLKTDAVLFNDTNEVQTVSATGEIILTLNTSTEEVGVDSGETILLGATTANPTGMLRKVIGITRNGTQVVVQTAPADLEDLLETGEFNQTIDFTAADLASAPLRDGWSIKRNPRKATDLTFEIDKNADYVLYDADGNNATTNDQLIARGSITLNMSMVLRGRYYYGLQLFDMQLNATETSNLELEATGAISFQKEISLGNLIDTKVKFLIGAVPVWIDVKIPIYIGCDGSAKVSAKTGVSRTANVSVGATYNDGIGWTDVITYNENYAIDTPEITGTIEAKIYAGPKLETTVYSVVGPTVNFYGFVKANATASTNSSLIDWNIWAGVESKVDCKMSVFKDDLQDYSKDLISESDMQTQLKYGALLTSINPETTTITVAAGNTYDLSTNKYIAKYNEDFYLQTKEVAISNSALSFEADGGTVSGNTWTAPTTTGTYTITVKYLENSVEKTADITATVTAAAPTLTFDRGPVISGISPQGVTSSFGTVHTSYDLAVVSGTHSVDGSILGNYFGTNNFTWTIKSGQGTITNDLFEPPSATVATSGTTVVTGTYNGTSADLTINWAIPGTLDFIAISQHGTAIDTKGDTEDLSQHDVYAYFGYDDGSGAGYISTYYQAAITPSWSSDKGGASGITFTPTNVGTHTLTASFSYNSVTKTDTMTRTIWNVMQDSGLLSLDSVNAISGNAYDKKVYTITTSGSVTTVSYAGTGSAYYYDTNDAAAATPTSVYTVNGNFANSSDTINSSQKIFVFFQSSSDFSGTLSIATP